MAELQQPNIVGNFLAAYGSGLERQQQQQDAAYQRQRQARADQMTEQKFNFDMDAGQLEMAMKRAEALNNMLAQLPEGDEAAFEAGKQRASLPVEQGGFGVPLAQMANLTVADLPRLKLQTGQTLKELQIQQQKANIRQLNAAAAASERSNRGGGSGTVFGAAAQRAQLAQAMGVDVNTPAGQRYVMTGQLPAAMSQADKKAVQDADEVALKTRQGIDMLKDARKLSDVSNSGPGMNTLAQVFSLVGDKTAENTLEFDNLLQNQVLPQLKAIFGGGITEGEREILLRLQGSSSLPYDVRNRIIDRAITMANQRLQFYEQQANELRSGDYYNSRQTTQRPAMPSAAVPSNAPRAAPAARNLPPIPPGFKVLD